MKDRIRLFLDKENKTSSQFAEEIGIQPSGVSHVLSGRNKPSLDFILKMLKTYSDLNSDWLLFGEGEMYRTGNATDLFDEKQLDTGHSGEEKYTEMSLFGGQNRQKPESGPGESQFTKPESGPGESQFTKPESGPGESHTNEKDKDHGENQLKEKEPDTGSGGSYSERIIVFYGDGTYSEYISRK